MMMLYTPNSQNTTAPTIVSVPPRQVRARDIKKLRTKAARAELAADLVSGKATLNLDPQMTAAICNVSRSYVAVVLRIRKCRPDLASRFRYQTVSSVAAAAGFGRVQQQDKLVTAWNRASSAERIEFVRRITPGRVWDEAIAPILA
jgi:hypothetical protein